MQLEQRILLDLFIIFVAAKIGGWLAARLQQPPVLGELLAGMLIGPHALGLIGHPQPELVAALGSEAAARAALETAYRTVAELGLVFLLFFVGLETRVEEIFRVGGRALSVGALGIALPFLLGYACMLAAGRGEIQALFVGAALVATSTGITARVLRDLDVIRSTEARVIIGAAVIDDVLSLTLLAVLANLSGSGRASLLDTIVLVIQAIAFATFVALVGTGVARRYGPHLQRTATPNAPLVLAVTLCLGLAVLASQIGLSPIVGAFLAGMVLAEARAHYDIEHAALPVYELLVPFFFTLVGAGVDLRLFADPQVLSLAVVLTALAIAGKLLGCGLGAWGLGWRPMLIIGVGMIPRGEVGLAAVSLGRALQAVPEEIFSIIVIVSLLTTVITPPVLAQLFAGPRLPEPVGLPAEVMAQQGRLPGLGAGQPGRRARRRSTHVTGAEQEEVLPAAPAEPPPPHPPAP
ncbi:MAG TPA: cation:proton antiporter [Chloroflexota bacterium]|nr:cation:proton antiporter [Chloroflexota bacterium]